MKIHKKYQIIIFFLIVFIVGINFSPFSTSEILQATNARLAGFEDGYILFSPMQSTKTYLIDSNGQINHTWSSNYLPGEAVYLVGDRNLLRTIKLAPSASGSGGGIQKITWDGEKIWEFTYYNNDHLSHHDIEPLTNGNVLMIAWEYFTEEEAIEQGRDPNKISSNVVKPDHIIEVEPTGPSSGEIVWEWHAWDHLIQDYDPSKENYGVVEDHPELIDLNFGSYGADWMHTNSIDYNEEFDQILLSVRNFHEIWVIDHSTTTEEAAGHTGGNSGKGGDLLYRWGNPQTYGAGTPYDQIFVNQHDARWIPPKYLGEGNILVFNNLGGYPEGFFTTIEEIEPPVDDDGFYYIEPGSKYGPDEQTWRYETEFYSWYVGGNQRLPNGNTLICDGPGGIFIEVTYEKDVVWEYQNLYPTPLNNNIFKIEYYPKIESSDKPNLDCFGSIDGKKIEVGGTFNDSFIIENIGAPGTLLNWKIESYPEWGNWSFNIESGKNLTPEDGPLTVEVSIIVPKEKNRKFEGYIRVENQDDPEDFDVIPVSIKTPIIKYFINQLINKILFHFEKLFTFFENILINI